MAWVLKLWSLSFTFPLVRPPLHFGNEKDYKCWQPHGKPPPLYLRSSTRPLMALRCHGFALQPFNSFLNINTRIVCKDSKVDVEQCHWILQPGMVRWGHWLPALYIDCFWLSPCRFDLQFYRNWYRQYPWHGLDFFGRLALSTSPLMVVISSPAFMSLQRQLPAFHQIGDHNLFFCYTMLAPNALEALIIWNPVALYPEILKYSLVKWIEMTPWHRANLA